jgi:hypothetical protein
MALLREKWQVVVISVVAFFGTLLGTGTTVWADEQAHFAVSLAEVPAEYRPNARLAMTKWEQATGNPNLFSGDPEDKGVIDISIEWHDHGESNPAVSEDALATTNRTKFGHETIATIDVCHTEITKAFPDSGYMTEKQLITAVFVHELGHAMGLKHVTTNRQDIMYPTAQSPTQQITALDLENLPFNVNSTAIVDTNDARRAWYSRDNLSNQMASLVTLPRRFEFLTPALLFSAMLGGAIVGQRYVRKQKAKVNM